MWCLLLSSTHWGTLNLPAQPPGFLLTSTNRAARRGFTSSLQQTMWPKLRAKCDIAHEAGPKESSGGHSAPRHGSPSSRSLMDAFATVYSAASCEVAHSTTGTAGCWKGPGGHSCQLGRQDTRDSHRNPAKVHTRCCTQPGSIPVIFAEVESQSHRGSKFSQIGSCSHFRQPCPRNLLLS